MHPLRFSPPHARIHRSRAQQAALRPLRCAFLRPCDAAAPPLRFNFALMQEYSHAIFFS
jgi:hypothetical protein